jgi:alpha/beta superfamily hydrolase
MNKRLLSLLLFLQVLSATAQTPATARSPHPADSAAGPSDRILQTASGNIYGTLVIPDTKKKMPVVLIIAGSGPVDRNGNTRGMESNVYHMLADSLYRHGIASLRYDKRGIGQSAAAMRSESDLTFGDMIGDAIGWIRLLKTDGRFSRVIVLGHSEGSLVGMVAAKEANADAYISVSGAGDRIDKIIETQLRARAPQLAEKATLLLDSLDKGYKVQEPGGNLNGLFRASIQPYMISWIRYDPPE